MDLDDLFDPKVAVAVALTAAVTSKPVRKALRQGAVYGMAGLLVAADRVSAVAGSFAEGAQQAAASVKQTTEGMTETPAQPSE